MVVFGVVAKNISVHFGMMQDTVVTTIDTKDTWPVTLLPAVNKNLC